MEKINLCFISNASTDIYSSNTLTKFRNKIPVPIVLNEHDRWRFSLKSFGVHLNYGTIKIPKDVPLLILLDLKDFQQHAAQDNDRDISALLHQYVHEKVLKKDKLQLLPKDYQIYELYKLLESFLKQSSFKGVIDIKLIPGPGTKSGGNLKLSSTVYSSVLLMHNFLNESLPFFHSNYSSKLQVDKTADDRLSAINGTLCDAGHNYLIHTFRENRTSLISKPLQKLMLKAPKFIKIKCSIVKPIQTSSGFDSFIYHTKVPIDAFNDREYFFKEVKVPLECELLSEQLYEIKFSITDESGEQLRISYGVPTLVNCVLEKKMISPKHFYVQVYSNTTNLFTENTPSAFSVQLQPPLQFPSDKGSVALVSATIPSKIANVPDIGKKNNVLLHTKKIKGAWSKTEVFKLPTGYFSSANDYINTLNDLLSNDVIQFILRNGYVFLKFHKACALELPRYVLKILGQKFEYGESDDSLDSASFIMTYQRGIEIYIGRMDIDLYLPRYALCYASFIQPSIVGSIYAQVLRILPLKKTLSNFISFEFDNLEFCPLNTNYIPTMDFMIRSHSGDEIKLAIDQLQEPVLLTLCFKTE